MGVKWIVAVLWCCSGLVPGQASHHSVSKIPKQQPPAYKEGVPPTFRWKAGAHHLGIDMSRDGSTVLTIDSVTGNMTTWWLVSGESTPKPQSHATRKGHDYVVISDDGKIGASNGDDATVLIWDTARLVKVAATDAGLTESEMSFAPGTHTLLYQTKAGFAAYDCDSQKVVSSAKLGLPGKIIFRVTDDGKTCVVGDLDGDTGLYLWRWKQEHAFEHVKFEHQITQLPFSTDGSLYVQGIEMRQTGKTAQLTTQVYTLDLETRRFEKKVDFATGSRFLAFKFYGPDLSVGTLHMQNVKPQDLLVNKKGKITTFLSSAEGKRITNETTRDGRFLYAAGDDGVVRVWDLTGSK